MIYGYLCNLFVLIRWCTVCVMCIYSVQPYTVHSTHHPSQEWLDGEWNAMLFSSIVDHYSSKEQSSKNKCDKSHFRIQIFVMKIPHRIACDKLMDFPSIIRRIETPEDGFCFQSESDQRDEKFSIDLPSTFKRTAPLYAGCRWTGVHKERWSLAAASIHTIIIHIQLSHDVPYELR